MKDKSRVILLVMGIGYTTKQFQNDTFYTIKVGESIIKNGLDNLDHFSWHKLPYTYPHWLYDIGIYEIYKNFDFMGVYISTIILYIIMGVIFYLINIKQSKSVFVSLFTSILTVIVCGVYATARAQLVSYILFILEVYFIERLLSSSNKNYCIYLFFICILVANIHSAVWPFYFVLYLPYIAQELLYLFKNKFIQTKESKIFEDKLIVHKYNGFKLLIIAMFISLFLGLLTPIGLEPYTYSIKIMLGSTQEYILEHAPLTLIENPFVIYFLIIFLGIVIFTKVKIRVSDFFMIFGLLIMSFMSVRHVSFLLIIGMLSLTRIIVDLFSIGRDEVFDLDVPWFVSLIILVVIVICSTFVYINKSNTDFINKNSYPIKATKYLKENYDIDKIRLFNNYNFGSYLVFENIPVYIDSRSDLYTKPFNKKFDIFNEYEDITNNYDMVFKRYKITHVLTYSTTELAKILSASSNYNLVYSDGGFVIFEIKSVNK